MKLKELDMRYIYCDRVYPDGKDILLTIEEAWLIVEEARELMRSGK